MAQNASVFERTGVRTGIALLLTLCACAKSPPPEEGVNVFSADTSTAHIMVAVTGTLQVGLRSDAMMTTRDRQLVLETPATLVFKKGDGEVTVRSVDTTQRIVLESIDTPLDTAASAAATGVIVRATRVAGQRQPRFSVEKP